MEERINSNELIYKSNKYRYDFSNVSTIMSFVDSIFNGKITINESKNQSSLLNAILDVNSKIRSRSKGGK